MSCWPAIPSFVAASAGPICGAAISMRSKRSILDRLYTLDDATLVVTGHGPETEIGWEKDRNQFVRA